MLIQLFHERVSDETVEANELAAIMACPTNTSGIIALLKRPQDMENKTTKNTNAPKKSLKHYSVVFG